MNRLVFFLALMPFASYSQGSWVSVEVQTDQYSAETTWDIVGDGEVWEESAPYFSNEFRQQVVFSLLETTPLLYMTLLGTESVVLLVRAGSV